MIGRIWQAIRRALTPTRYVPVAQCSACLADFPELEHTDSGFMCRTCAAQWREHQAERERTVSPILNIRVESTPGVDLHETMERIQREIASATRIPQRLMPNERETSRTANTEAIARAMRNIGASAEAVAEAMRGMAGFPDRNGNVMSEEVIQQMARAFIPVETNCPQGREHDWLPWMTATGERQGDICSNCALTRREASAVERPPIQCDHRWVTEENLADRTFIVTCRTCRETHTVQRDVLEASPDGIAGLGWLPQFRNGRFVGGTIPTGRVTARTPIPARPRAPNPPEARQMPDGTIVPNTPPNQGGSGRRRASTAPSMPPPPPKRKPKRLHPVAPRPPRPLILDDDDDNGA